MTTHAQLPEDLACTKVVEMITDYLEGALPEGERRRLERHLESCPGCSEYFEQVKAVSGSLAGITEDSLPADARQALLAVFRDLRK